MRILHLVLSKRAYGSERAAVLLANAQSELGHDVAFLAPRGSGVLSLLRNSVTPIPVSTIERIFGIHRRVADARPDVMHCHLSSACKLASSMRNGPAAVATLHLGYKRRQHARLDGLIALTEAERARASESHPSVAHVATPRPRLEPVCRDGSRSARADLGIREGVFLIGYCGRLHPSKAPMLLVDAFKAAQLADASLVFAGDGPERRTIARAVASDRRISLAGYVSDVRAFYSAIDLLVLPSLSETFGLVLLEAMECGVPIVAAAAEGPAEILKDSSQLFPVGDAPALTAMLERERAAGRRRIEYDLSRFDPLARAAEVVDFYARTRARRDSVARA